jgi:hypothetical protein
MPAVGTLRMLSNLAFVLAFLVFVGGVAVGIWGTQHEIARIPLTQREQMTDFDWIGEEWIMRGECMIGVAVILATIGFLVRRGGRRATSRGVK